MATTILLVRHAAHGHLGHTLSGRMPGIALSAHGERQAAALAARLGGEALGAVLTSPVQRARQTAEFIAEAGGVQVTETAALDEIDFGTWTGKRFDELDGDPDWERWNTGRASARVPGGESMTEAQNRVVGAIRYFAERQLHPVLAMVTHCDIIRAAVCWALDLSLDQILRFEVDVASITRLVVDDGAVRLQTLNERT